MISFPRLVLAFAALLVSVASGAGAAQQSTDMAGMKMSETKSAASYHPGLGELMTAFVQPRHIKLGLAGNEQNWPYAAYELEQLRETFADVAEIMPKFRDLSIPDLITLTVNKPLAALDAAIQAQDGTQFAAPYGQLTVSCNACHRSYD